MTAQRIHQDLVAQVGCWTLPVGQTLRVALALCYPGSRLAYRGQPGEEALVDFSTGGWVIDTVSGVRRRSWSLRVVSSFSRAA